MFRARHLLGMLAGAAATGACASSSPAGDDGLTAGESEPTLPDGDDDTGEEDTGDDPGDLDLPLDTDLGGAPCESPWDPPWIGSACDHDEVCDFELSLCLLEEEGFPCGTCSQPCDGLCPDLEGAPTTFCVDSGDLSLPAGDGLCLSQCDPPLLGGDGCRDGYACAVLPRFAEPATTRAVCVPEALAPEPTDCLTELEATGAVFEPTDFEPEHPDTHPELTCVIDQPVLLYGPIHGVGLRYFQSAGAEPILTSCPLALAVVETAALLAEMGTVELLHMGTYNCRVISGTDTLSEHAFANAIDLYGFTREDDSFLTVYDDWEDGVAEPVTEGGQWLRDLTDTLWADGVYNIILTPNYNAAHDDHVHADLTPGGSYYE